MAMGLVLCWNLKALMENIDVAIGNCAMLCKSRLSCVTLPCALWACLCPCNDLASLPAA